MPPKNRPTTTNTTDEPLAKRHRREASATAHGNNNETTLTKQKEEEMSSAYIAQLLAEEDGYMDEHPYYSEYNSIFYEPHYESDNMEQDDDYTPGARNKPVSRSKKAVTGSTRGRKRKAQLDSDNADHNLENLTNKLPENTGTIGTLANALENMASQKEFSDSAIQNKQQQMAPLPESTTIDKTLLTQEASSSSFVMIRSELESKPPVNQESENNQESAKGNDQESAKGNNQESAKGNQNQSSLPTNESSSLSGLIEAGEIKKRKEKVARPKNPGMNSGTYTEQEEFLFLEALERWGRDWQKLAEHIGTRDPNSIRSHAQKHFIKLFRDGIPLPLKVQESGCGYTLSGKDLDPESAAAKPYLSRMKSRSELPVQTGSGSPPSGTTTPKGSHGPRPDAPIPTSASTTPNGKKPIQSSKISKIKEEKEKKAPKLYKRKEPRTTQEVPSHNSNNTDNAYGSDGRTEYAKSRLRNIRERPSINFKQIDGNDTDPLTMVKCEPFCGAPNSNVHGCQPFSILVESNVLLAMDFHAHLMQTEIIGFLAGHWHPEEKKLIVKATFPCRSLATGQDHVNVEMDPTSETEVREAIQARNMRVVGWYHSHPTFVPDPSIVDIENQKNYQNLFRDEAMNEEPFVGAIIGPYDPKLPSSLSVINWYYVSNNFEERGQPKQLAYELFNNNQFSKQEADELLKLVEEYRTSKERVNFQEYWRKDIEETKLDKLIKSLGRRMPWLYPGKKQQQTTGNLHLPNQPFEPSLPVPNSEFTAKIDEDDPLSSSTEEGGEDLKNPHLIDEINFDSMALDSSFMSIDSDVATMQPQQQISVALADDFLRRVESMLKAW
ncbi:9607_t:CDS:2 [Ambispora gerdemannii]|uniref:9607_t:CDS:1 n=1 Tax=Ambispora gerdemannii TaxID=144530 RepID=A0A9N8YK66_9GLOM|nr:9607_t:CDS:2 [Ambispora gerdemannii]